MVVVGFSGASDSVPPLLWAAQEAARRGSTLTVLSAVSVQGVLTGPGGDQGMVAPEAAAAAEQALAEARATVADVEGLTMEGKVVFGSPAATLVDASADADLVVGAVLIVGAAAPKLVTREMLKTMRPGSVLVDVAIDQGGCFETSRPTTHAEPTYVVDEIVHYCVANMPGAVARTSTFALNNATLPFVLALAGKGIRQALLDDPHLLAGLNVHAGEITCPPVAEALGVNYLAAREALAGSA